MNRIRQEKLAKTIREKREKLNMSQLDLAKKTGINRAIISRIENNTFMPSIEQLEDLQEVLNFTDEEIRENKQEEKTTVKVAPKKIAVAGTGYVGMSIAVLLAQHNTVKAVDIIPEKVKMINQKKEKGWDFVFIGANIDAVETARHFGIDEDHAVDCICDEIGTQTVYKSVSKLACNMRANMPYSASWNADIKADYKKRKR